MRAPILGRPGPRSYVGARVAKQNGAQAALIKVGSKPEVLHAAVAQAISAVPCRDKSDNLRSVRFRRTSSDAVVQ
jgi:hypothetical protein